MAGVEERKRMKLTTLSTGDVAYRFYKSILVLFAGKRKVLSTSVLNGGYREDLTAVFNNDCNPGAGMACTMRAPTYEEHLRIMAAELGVEPDQATGMSTAASMNNVAIVSEQYEALTVTALVTGGVEVNGGRVGDPATHYKPVEKARMDKPGTINIMLFIDADLPPGILARALVTCTEAKTAALQELLAGSNYSTGLATGSGTDSTIVIANPESALYFESAGKHCKLGELIGCAVKKAVKEALLRQNGLSPKYQHSVLKRLKRFGINEETLWKQYQSNQAAPVAKAKFVDTVYQLDQLPDLVTYTSLFVHLLDQLDWQLLSGQEVEQAGNQLLQLAAQCCNTAVSVIGNQDLDGFLAAWQNLFVAVLEQRIHG
ncbi:hypothetical protein SPFL3102_01829 [Sporomusaceae bacterium FL31]|nr:hypothetical protein SPFL3101_03463 [Sporomusaceae bacterium FL31]GCE34020.1 hypothetical protein SPFL3102_01829 [Sporomusaceae bacterium]